MHISYRLYDNSAGSLNISTNERKSITFRSPCYNSRTCTPYIISLSPAIYRIEAWGSSGSSYSNANRPGKGAYAKGLIIIRNRIKLYAYIGTKVGYNSQQTSGGAQGGGATDLRLFADEWYNFESLKSRIFVAGGGGGNEWKCSVGGNAGLIGSSGYGCSSEYTDSYDSSFYCSGGTQTSGGKCPSTLGFFDSPQPTYAGTFGSSGDNVPSIDLGGMGGGGYYGGGSASVAGAGGGGSSFISGHPECTAIDKESTSKSNIKPASSSVHYSGIQFYETEIISGGSSMPYYLSKTSFTGNTDDGALRISLFSSLACTLTRKNYHSLIISYIFLIYSR